MMHPYINKNRLNRELSWLLFNERVLQEARDPEVPLIERMRFLGIFSNNQDEFFRVRVATIKRLSKLGPKAKSLLGYSPQKLLNQIQERVIEMQKLFHEIYQEISEELEKENIFIINEDQLNDEQMAYVASYFSKVVEPLLVPIMLKNVPRFPYLKDKSIYLFIVLTDAHGETDMAIMEIPRKVLSRFLVVPSQGKKKTIIYLDDVIRLNLGKVFSIFNYRKMESYVIKITRDAELDIDDDISESYFDKMKRGLEKRKKGEPVRFIYDRGMPEASLKYLMKKLRLNEDDNIIPGGRYHNFRDFMGFPNVGGSHLEFEPRVALEHPSFIGQRSLLGVLAKEEVLLHFPYQRYDYVIDLLREAAIDAKVTEIRISLYRVASDSRIINALVNAVKNGKTVLVVMELQARFDEEANLKWSKTLTDEGVRLVFGISGLKIHSKLLLIKRRENKEIRRYAYIGTGNFHEGTARVYSDLALLTSDPALGLEVERVFNLIEKPYLPTHFDHLFVSPVFMRKHLMALIDQEIASAKMGNASGITFKVNSLVDDQIVDKLYEASRAGVPVRMIVRGICNLIPGINEVSEHIQAISIVGRYLEHARIYCFHNQGQERIYIASADLMTRNLDYRIEVAVPVYAPLLKKEIRDFLDIQFSDNVKARILDENMDNRYVRNKKKKVDAQEAFYQYLKNKLKH